MMKTTSAVISVSVFLLALSGCASNGGVGRVGSPLWDLTTSDEEKWAYYEATCERYGLTKGTPQFTDCLIATKASVDSNTSSGWDKFRDASSRMGVMGQ